MSPEKFGKSKQPGGKNVGPTLSLKLHVTEDQLCLSISSIKTSSQFVKILRSVFQIHYETAHFYFSLQEKTQVKHCRGKLVDVSSHHTNTYGHV